MSAAAKGNESNGPERGNHSGGSQQTMQQYAEAMQPGWNLGNTLDATGEDETSWGNPRVTKELIHQIAAQGYKSIRIPITWQQRMGNAPAYKIDPAFMDRVEEVVDWSLDEGLYVMINMHHDSWLWVKTMGTDHDGVLARYNAGWTQIAERFKNHSNKLMFESINEPRFNDGWGDATTADFALLDELNTSMHQIVRDSGANNAERPIVLPTYATSGTQAGLDELYKTITKLNDPNLIATIHYYGYWPFSVNVAGGTRFDDNAKNDLTQTFDRAYNTLVAKGIPVVLGEFGLLGFDKNIGTIEQGEKLKYFEFLTSYLKEKKITQMLWDNGQHFNRTTYKWSDTELFNILNMGLKGRSSTAASDLIYVKKDEAVQDTSVALNLNGNQLTGIESNGKKLNKGDDYTLDGDVLTFKASFLSKVTDSGQLGENAVLTAQFNKGPDWRFHVLRYNTPVLYSYNGIASTFSIPTSFNGDRLATMEAEYTTGGYAGPQSWTAFKEFGYAFTPSYDTNEIKLLPAFFNEVNDGQVNLKFHFWSGNVITYTITKSGTSITGIAS
ncbi:cellulase family glycosylhydrolase [Paenibacillus sp. NEAU-GSW1]|nr:cellulase family glycosylhydrolase [Paenibacillus sp. NEAU-GSW1]